MTETSLDTPEPSEEWTMKDLYPYVPELEEVETKAREERMRKIIADNTRKIFGKGISE